MSPLENMARAMAKCRAVARAERDQMLLKKGLWPDRNWQPSDADLARAALLAIREPSKPQQLALLKASVEYPGTIHDGEVCWSAAFFERSWTMQIDAILAEEPRP